MFKLFNKDISVLQKSSLLLFKWLNNNFMKVNSNESPLSLSWNEPSTIVIHGSCNKSNRKEIFIGIRINRQLKLDDHIINLCKKACQKT